MQCSTRSLRAAVAKGVEAYSYLRDVLTPLPSMTKRQIKDIVPEAWAAAKKPNTET